jgi:hypothetical protein
MPVVIDVVKTPFYANTAKTGIEAIKPEARKIIFHGLLRLRGPFNSKRRQVLILGPFYA